MHGEIEIRLSDGRVYFGKIGSFNLNIREETIPMSFHGGMVERISTGHRRMTIEAELLEPTVQSESVFKKRDAEKPKSKSNKTPLPIQEYKRAITFKD